MSKLSKYQSLIDNAYGEMHDPATPSDRAFVLESINKQLSELSNVQTLWQDHGDWKQEWNKKVDSLMEFINHSL